MEAHLEEETSLPNDSQQCPTMKLGINLTSMLVK